MLLQLHEYFYYLTFVVFLARPVHNIKHSSSLLSFPALPLLVEPVFLLLFISGPIDSKATRHLLPAP